MKLIHSTITLTDLAKVDPDDEHHLDHGDGTHSVRISFHDPTIWLTDTPEAILALGQRLCTWGEHLIRERDDCPPHGIERP